MPETTVSMPITGKILEESLMFMNTKKSNVLSGRLKISYRPMQMDANKNTGVSFLMAGKSKNTIRSTTKCMLVDNKIYVRSLIVRIFIQIKTGDNQ
jgi:hypothetical protein